MSDARPLPSGTYEHLVTHGLDRQLGRVAEHLVQRRGLDAADAHEVLTRHIAALTRRALRSVAGTNAADLARQVDLANRICAAIADIAPKATSTDEVIATSRDLLLAIMAPSAMPGAVRFPDRPHIALTSSALLVNGRDQPRVGREVGLELATADRVDLLCAFVKWSGLRIIEPALREFGHRDRRLRVLTTTYTGATERRALDRLVELGAEVRVSFETRTTRLHAKAWLFRRDNGLDTAYVGSSNLSRAALVDGVEWNVRLTAAEQPHLLDTFAATFEDYWNDPGCEPYDPQRDHSRLDYALAHERGVPVTAPVEIAMMDVRPFGYQGEVLDELDARRRVHGQWKNLVVMATGTGKTVVAALDYRRLHRSHEAETLLYIAHREEILRQSLSVFRQVMRDGAFGELAVGGERPTQWRQVFASVQSLHKFDLADLDPQGFDVVIVDEFHHAEAKTYTRLLEHLRPRVLLGLTATPERADGLDVTRWFGGQAAVELRLWEALERQLLVPFHYFGIHDDVSLENVRWRRGKGYDDAEIDKIYTGNDARVRLILTAVAEKVPDVGHMRAMGFCVSIAHAKYMAERFTTCGVPARAITADSLPGERRKGLTDLAARRINVIFTVDLFNEGIDIPDIDTILLLRPTQSATIFLQQLGRGLRLADDKSVLTVLDFVGAQRAEFRFDLRFRALTGSTRRRLARDLEEGFPSLPSGCHIHLDPVAARIVLDNVRRSLQPRWGELINQLRALGGGCSLRSFLDECDLDLADIYRSGLGWASLRRAAGLDERPVIPGDVALGKALARMLHVDDIDRLAVIRRFLGDPEATPLTLPAATDERGRRERNMLCLALTGSAEDPDAVCPRVAALLRQHPARREELADLADVLQDRIHRVTHPLDPTGPVPLRVYARYSRNEALAAFGMAQAVSYMRQGVIWIPSAQADLFFVTLVKTEAHFSPTTMYADRAVTPTIFQWESQNRASPNAPVGQRYIHHKDRGSSVHLFVRETSAQDGHLGAPAYLYAGPMSYLEHRGDRPMRILWRLDYPLPSDMFHAARAVAA